MTKRKGGFLDDKNVPTAVKASGGVVFFMNNNMNNNMNNKKLRACLLFGGVFAAAVSPAIAVPGDEDPAVSNPADVGAVAQPAASAGAARPTPPTTRRSSGVVRARVDETFIDSLSLVDESIAQVLSLLGKWTDRIIIQGEGLPKSTVNLDIQKPLSREKAIATLMSALAANKVAVVPMGDDTLKAIPINQAKSSAPRIVDREALPTLASSQEVCCCMFRLENLTAREGARTVMPWVTPLTSSVVALDKANALFVTDSLANLQQLDNIFSRIDRVGDVQDAILWFQPKNASVESLKASFEDLQKGALKYYLLGNTSFASDKNTNSFIVVTPKGNEPMIREFVEKLDATVDPLVQHHVFRIQHGSSKEITELIKKLMSQQKETNSGTQAGASTAAFSEKLSIECDERLNAIVAYGTPSDIRQIQNLLNQLDVVLPQIRLEVVIAEVRLTDGQASGLESFGFKHGDGVITKATWTTDGKESKDYAGFSNQLAPGAASIPGVTSPILSGLVNWGKHSKVTIDGVLNAAKTKQNIKIVSSPTLLTTHAREATLSVVETRPYIKALQTKAGSGATDADVSNSTVDQVDAGIVLTIKPWIGTDGTVQLEIDQKIDNFTANSMTVGSSNNRVTIPYINKRQLKSFVSAKSGEMIVLGGLKKKETTRTKRKTFLLGDIPGIGELFTGKGKSEETTEMIVFIRPVLLQNNDAVRADTELYKENLTSKTRDEVNAYEETGRFSDKPEMDEDDKRKQRIKELKAERKAEAEEARQVRKEKQMRARAERAERQAREESASRASRRAHARKTSVAHTTQANVSEAQTSRRGHIRRAHRAVAEPKVQAQQAVQGRRASRSAVRRARQTIAEPTKSEVNRPRPRVRAHRRR